MGRDVTRDSVTRADRAKYRHKVRRCLDVFALMLDEFQFDADRPTTGLEVELNLVDAHAEPAMRNEEILDEIDDPAFQSELGRFNIELNAEPRLIEGAGFDAYEKDLTESLGRAAERAAETDSRIVLVGILPTLTTRHTVRDNLSANDRYQVLNEQILDTRGEDIPLDIRGVEELRESHDSIVPEAACTSVQYHLQVSPEHFADYWNAAQAIAAIQVATGANSPYLFGRRLWAETRIALFEQATDTRADELKAQGVRPRVWFGERWITSIFDLFEENVRYFTPLLPVCDDEDPQEVLRAGGVPTLSELTLHNGTVYRWNRPVYDIMDGRPHLRVENRVLPAGPTVVDMLANAAFYFGLTRYLAEQDRPVWSRLGFHTAEDNFHLAARRGITATVRWPRHGDVPVTRLVLDELLDQAAQGLDRYGVDLPVRDRLLGVIEGRCRAGRNGAVWQTEMVSHGERHGLDRDAALRAMLQRYSELQRTDIPVHLWPVG
ncbi:glutamate--cysteine ligase [Pilimelia terevasa]|uniref:Glutamate--cysteine ligase n=1 Tax=Pilimelia terevasa TaxID=53372 RepID=A0A8J3FJU7_9ACTN|nr:glutamate--cysteine ligase [Pilimelia terevasa]GGK34904.1 glutamate--cysteine ligase [Pilimelia terevasa]